MNKVTPKSILIVGGGTAGWMAANILLHAWGTQGLNIALVESQDIGIIGVGEGSTPAMRKLFGYLKVAEQDWMPVCNATYKGGIFFDGWSTRPGFQNYFHPFYSTLDIEPARTFFHNLNLRRRGYEAPAHPDQYFLTTLLAQEGRAPLPLARELASQIDYGYHFDAALLGRFLRDRAIGRGLVHLIDTVENVALNSEGAIASVNTRNSGELTADFYVDCTGFAGLLINQALQEPVKSFKENLFNDAAVTIATANDGPLLASATRATALPHGWAWQIPLTNRCGNGYVYSQDFISAEQAERELRLHLGAGAEALPARHLRMRVGRVEQHWKKNCLAVGLSQGFIEPLEATALAIVQSTLENFVDSFDRGPVTEVTKGKFNQYVNGLIDGIRDYIVAHYYLNTRDDTDYWRAYREQSRLSPSLLALVDVWDSGGDFMEALFSQQRERVYKPESWCCLFAGMGRFPAIGNQRVSPPALAVEPVQQRRRQVAETCFPFHRQLLANRSL